MPCIAFHRPWGIVLFTQTKMLYTSPSAFQPPGSEKGKRRAHAFPSRAQLRNRMHNFLSYSVGHNLVLTPRRAWKCCLYLGQSFAQQKISLPGEKGKTDLGEHIASSATDPT